MRRAEQSQAERYQIERAGDEYHVKELEIALDATHPGHSLPKIERGEKVLDIGCGAGQTLIAACPYRVPGEGGLCVTCSRSDCSTWGYGIDVDEEALELGHRWTRQMALKSGSAMEMPYGDDEFDVVISRVALVWTNLPKSVSEMRRVLRPGGRIWLTMHQFSMVTGQIRGRNWKGLLHLAYVALNGVLFHLTLRTVPLFGRYESWQTSSSITRLLQREGFSDIQVNCTDRHMLVTARG
jgi:ubiquinone/menaquinone biosynthesis C-methylase UbiE